MLGRGWSLFAMSILLGAGCRGEAPSAAASVEPPPLAKTPAPTRDTPGSVVEWTPTGDMTLVPGEIWFEMSGARQLRGHMPLSYCEIEHGGLLFSAVSTDASTASDGLSWALDGASDPEGGPRSKYGVALFEQKDMEEVASFEWTGAMPPQLREHPQGRASFDVELKEIGGPGRIAMHVEIACPKPDPSPRIPEELVTLLGERAGVPVLRFSSADGPLMPTGPVQKDPRWVSVVLPSDQAARLVSTLRGELPPGFTAYLGAFGFESNLRDVRQEVVVAKVVDPLDILRTAGTDAGNYGILTEGLILRLRPFVDRYGMVPFGASDDSVTVKFTRPPKPARALAEEIFAVCPDILDQGYRDLDHLGQAIEAGEQVHLWWD